jgi:hypothetical protein
MEELFPFYWQVRPERARWRVGGVCGGATLADPVEPQPVPVLNGWRGWLGREAGIASDGGEW